jgi:hypothetical protein
MGSSARKKKEKKKDFQVSFAHVAKLGLVTLNHSPENEIESWEDQGQAGQFY